jgi:hypothetical protein
MAACDCDVVFGNSGTPTCVSIGSVTFRLIGVPTYDSTGAKNFIDTTATLDSAYFTAALNNTDSTKRWYPLPEMKNVEDVRGEDLTESFNDGSTAFIQEGSRTFTGITIKNPSPVLLGKIKKWRCSEISVFVIDVDGNILGDGSEADKLYPFKLDSETWSPKYMKTTDTTVAKIQIDYTYSKDEVDENIRMIAADETSVDVKDLDGLIDVNAGAATSISTTGFSTELTYDYGTAVTKQKFKGGVLADFTLYNETTTASVTITSVTEATDGNYDFVIPAQTSADVLTLSLSKDGFEMTDLTVTIP